MNTILTGDERPKLPPAKNYLGDDASWGYDASDMEAYADAREAAVLAKLREQEPVAVVKENPHCPEGHSDELSTYLPVGMKLYASPVPELMPVQRLLADLDEIIRLTVSVSRSSEPTTTDYYETLNRRNELVRDFRIMLAAAPEAPAQTGVQVPELMKRVQSVTDNTLTRSGFFDAIAAAPEAPAKRCTNCDDTGDVHDQTGEWRGRCECPAGQELPAKHRFASAAPQSTALPAEVREALKVARQALEAIRFGCENIATSDWRGWQELASPQEFERWAKSRAAHMTDAARAALARLDALGGVE